MPDNPDEALRAGERSVALGPGDAENLECYGDTLAWFGQYGPALRNIDRAIELNPIVPAYYLHSRARALYGLGRYAEAAVNCLEKRPGWTLCYHMEAGAEAALGHMAEAKALITELQHKFPGRTLQDVHAHLHDPPTRARLLVDLRAAGLPDGPADGNGQRP